MKATIRGEVAELEGSPSEVAEALKLLGISNIGSVPKAPQEPSGEQPTASKALDGPTVGFAQAVLTRRPLSKEQKTIFSLLSKAHPQTVPATELAKAIDYTAQQFSGLVGAIGRRVSRTKGYVPGRGFFERVWDDQLSCYRYRLPDSVREAISREKLA